MTGPPISPADRTSGLPPRILSPEEWEHAQTLTPEGLRRAEFPAVPTYTPKARGPNAPPSIEPDAALGAAGVREANPQAVQLTGPARILTQYVAEPLWDHPILSMAAVLPPVAAYFTSVMAKDVTEYAAQKAAELSLPTAERKLAEKDPERISGEQAAVEGTMLALGPLIHEGIKRGRRARTPVTEATKVGEGGTSNPEAAAAAGLEPQPSTQDLHRLVPEGEPGVRIEPHAPGAKIMKVVSRGEDGKPNGLLVLSRTGAKSADAFTVFVDPAVRRKGIATSLYKTAEDAGIEIRSGQSGFTPEGKAFVEKRTGQPAPESGLQNEADQYVKEMTSALEKDRASSIIRGHVDRVTDAWNKIFAPATRSTQAAQAATIMRASTGEMARSYEQAAFKLDEFRRAVEPLSEADKLGFIDAIEGGRSQPTPEFQKAADTIRETLDTMREQIRSLGTGKLENFIENYFPHIWADPEKAADAFAEANARSGSRRPLEGSKAFLKERTIPTTAEGMALGLTPITTNPVDLTMLKLREMQRYYMAHTSLKEMQDAGLVKYVRSGGEIPSGYTRINDKIATVFGPREGGVQLPAEANIRPEEVRVPGMRIMGEYWAPEPVARIVNNYLSPGLRGNPLYDAYRGLGNTLNQFQLGFSAFHLGFTSMDASVSRVALGLEYISSGHLSRGFREMLSAPVAPVTNMRLGARVRAAYLDPEHASPDMKALANAVAEAGGRVRMDSFYRNSAPERMIEAWRKGEYGKAVGLSVPAAVEFTMKPLMEYIVPMQKLGVFGDLARKTMDGISPEASLAERRQALADAWDSVDNRMGQLVYDNLFWSKSFKDMAMASVRSVGWNLGTIRELGGGTIDLTKSAARVSQGEAAELSHRAFYVMALPMTVGFYGALYQYLRTGEGPQETKDYFFPRTGEVDADGNPERVQIASYMKDFFAYMGHPWQTVKHKMNPILSAVYEMLENEDFYGDMIRNPDDPFVLQIAQEAGYIAQQLLPFSVRNVQEQSKRGDQSRTTKIGNWFGITPAPRSEVRTEAQNRMMEFLSRRQMSGATPEDAEARQTRSEILRGMRGNSDIKLGQAVNDAIERHQLTVPDIVRLLKRAGLTPAQERFKRLTLPEAVDVFRRATRHEKELFAEALLNKVMRAEETAAQ